MILPENRFALFRNMRRSCPRLADMSWVQALPGGPPAPVSGLAAPAEDAAHQFGGAPDAGLAQDVGAVAFDRARAQSERLRDFLGAFAERDSLQHLPFAVGEMRLVPEIGWNAALRARDFAQRGIDARDDIAAVERLGDEIEGAAADGVDGKRNAGFRRAREHRRPPVRGADALQQIEAALVANPDVEKHAERNADFRARQQSRAVRKADHLVARQRQRAGQRRARGRIVVDDKNLASGIRITLHENPRYEANKKPAAADSSRRPPAVRETNPPISVLSVRAEHLVAIAPAVHGGIHTGVGTPVFDESGHLLYI